jgi:beta-glucanase (GH16 family)
MKVKNFKKIVFGILAAVIVTFSFSGCELFGSGNGGNGNSEPAVYISQSDISLAVGDTVQLQATSTDGGNVSWDSSNTAVATVVNGLVTGVAKGEAIIMAATDSVMAVCNIKVNDAPVDGGSTDTETLVLSLSTLSLEVGNSVTLVAKSSVEGAEIIWDSSNKTVATVSNGKVTAKTVGKTTITVTTGTAIASCEITVTETAPAGAQKPGYNLVWYDEFNGTSLNTSKWGYQTGTCDQYGSFNGADHNVNYWGNDELQYYTQDAVSVTDGALKITAKKQNMGDRAYTSGRILTRDKASFTYGYFEARIKTPTGNGMWPAFWMLPQPPNPNSIENEYGGWPANGEIDIMEAKGRLNNKVDTTLHFGKAWDAHDYVTQETTLSSNTDQWHTYAVDWTADAITWYVDGQSVLTVTKNRWWSQDASNQGQSMPFDKPFYIIFNLAVGGNYDGGVAPDASFASASMYVDYVRVYEKV